MFVFGADRAGACRRTSVRPVTAHRPPLVEQNVGPVVDQQRTDVVAVLAQVFHFGVVVQVPLLVVRVPTRGRVMTRLQIGTVMVTDGVQVVDVLATTVRGFFRLFPGRPAVNQFRIGDVGGLVSFRR